MDPNFCRRYSGDGTPPSNRYCRSCPHAHAACDLLWQRVVRLAGSSGGRPVPLPGTRAVLFPNPKNPDFVRLQVNCRWNLPKEDFLHYIATGHAGMGRKGQRSIRIPEHDTAGTVRAGHRGTARRSGYPGDRSGAKGAAGVKASGRACRMRPCSRSRNNDRVHAE